MIPLDSSRPLVLVYLAACVQGSAVVRAALARGYAVRALVRDRSRAQSVGLGQGHVEWAEADLDDADALRAASAGADHAVLQVPTGPADTMAARARNAAAASAAAGLRSVVLKLASASRPAPCGEPSFVGNAKVEAALRQAGLAFATVRPTMYLDNLLKPSARREIAEEGLFAPPIAAARRIAWTSADDCARGYRAAGARRHRRPPHRGGAQPRRRCARGLHRRRTGAPGGLPRAGGRCVRTRGGHGPGRGHGGARGLQVPLLCRPP